MSVYVCHMCMSATLGKKRIFIPKFESSLRIILVRVQILVLCVRTCVVFVCVCVCVCVYARARTHTHTHTHTQVLVLSNTALHCKGAIALGAALKANGFLQV